MHDNRAMKNKLFSNVTYTTKVTVAFVFVAAMTAVVAFGVLSFIWEQHFQMYTRDNIQRIADTTANAISTKYHDAGNEWYTGALNPARNISDISEGIGVQVLDAAGEILYDTSITTESASEVSLAPTNNGSLAVATICVDGEDIGTVHVWAYGSTTLLTAADQKFRKNSYQVMIFSSLLAMAIALILGISFARSLVRPINRISRAAKRIGDGDIEARTEMHGEDEISKLGETFDAMADSIQKNQQLERCLTTDVAHELRTPLMGIQSTVEAMLDGVFEPDAERLGTVDAEVQRLSRLVNTILKLSRLESRSTELHKRVVNVGALIQSIISTHEAFVHDSGLELVYGMQDDVYVYGDPDMICQATANLLSNAIRYTPKGTIHITVGKGDKMAYIAVADTGIGLTDEEAEKVFARFWRANAGRNRAQGGLGVGLSLVKEIVEQHDGFVRVEGKKGEGSTFTIFIPLFAAEQEPATKQQKRQRDKGRYSKREAKALTETKEQKSKQ